MHTAQEERDQADKQARATRVRRVAEAIYTGGSVGVGLYDTADQAIVAKECFDMAEAFEREAETRSK